MAVTWSEGLILNVVSTSPPADARAAMVASILRAGLPPRTRAEAQWAERAIRINAVGPRALLPDESTAGAAPASEADLAALALYLASRRGRQPGHAVRTRRGRIAGVAEPYLSRPRTLPPTPSLTISGLRGRVLHHVRRRTAAYSCSLRP